MISKAQIKYLSGAASYVRGQDIYQNGSSFTKEELMELLSGK